MNPLSAFKSWLERRFLGGNALGGSSFGISAALPAPVLSGVSVTPETALTFTTFFAALEARCVDVATLPLEVRRRGKDQRITTLPRDPRYNLVYCEPNKNLDSERFRLALHGHWHGWGNGYAQIVRRDGWPVELLLHSPRPTDTWPEFSRNGTLWYQIEGGRKQVRAEDMIHVAGLGFNGLAGYSKVALHRQAVGYGMALEQYGAGYYGNALIPAGVLKHPSQLTVEQKQNMRESFSEIHAGPASGHRLMILDQGLDFAPITTISPEDADYLAARNFQRGEMCAILGVPQPRIMDFSESSSVYKALEDMMQAYISGSLGPDARILERQLNRKLFTARERAHGLHVSHDFTALTAGNLAARAAYYKARFELGTITPDEIRAREGDNPIPGIAGNRFYVSNQYRPVDDDDDKEEQEPPEPAPNSDPTPDPSTNDAGGDAADEGLEAIT